MLPGRLHHTTEDTAIVISGQIPSAEWTMPPTLQTRTASFLRQGFGVKGGKTFCPSSVFSVPSVVKCLVY